MLLQSEQKVDWSRFKSKLDVWGFFPPSLCFQGAVEWDQLAARRFRAAGLFARQPSVLGVSEPAQLPLGPQELAHKEAEVTVAKSHLIL